MFRIKASAFIVQHTERRRERPGETGPLDPDEEWGSEGGKEGREGLIS